MTIQAAISKMELSFTETEKKIANYIMQNGGSIAKMNSTELSAFAGTSQSSIIKFVKKIGFDCFTDFKIQIHEDFINKEQVESLQSQNVSLEDPLEDVVRAIYRESMDSLSQTYKHIEHQRIKDSIDLLEHANRIYICGKGASFLPAQDLTSKLLKFGFTVICLQDLETMELTAASAQEEDVYVCFSFSGETKELIQIFTKAKANRAKLIVITKNTQSTLGRLSDLCIEIVTNEPKYRAASMSSRIVFFSIVDVLYLGVLKKDLSNRLQKIK